MPQFDIFSFSSQLFWVFFSFSLLYASLAYYLLPALAISLKVRKRKLLVSQSSGLSNTSNLVESSSGAVSSFDVSLDSSLSQKDAFLSNGFVWKDALLDVSIVEKTSLKSFTKRFYSQLFALSVG